MTKILRSFLLLTVLCGALPRPAQAAIIEYEAIDLADQVAGEDLWQYRYVVSGFVFNADQGFAIYADSGLYRDLSTPGAPNADWDPLVVQPDLGLPADGFLDELALVDGASLADAFVLDFVWLGGVAGPGAQPYELYTLDSQGVLTVIGGGSTRVAGLIPEPAALSLVALGLAGVVARRRFRG